MAVYVDDMLAPLRGMKMSHMVADTREELLEMVDRIGLGRHRIQYPDTYKEHFDIAQSKKAIALRCGAVPVTRRQLGAMVEIRRRTGRLGDPDTALETRRALRTAERATETERSSP